VSITICESSDDGHRLNWVRYFEREAALMQRSYAVEPSLARAMAVPGPLIIPMLEQRTMKNLAVMAMRALRGRRTLCLVLRATYAVRSRGVGFAVKRALLRVVRRLPGAGLLSILPVALEPRTGALLTGWIYDPEICDLGEDVLLRTPAPEIAALRDRAAGRMIVVALGRQVEGKGFGFFCDLWAASPEVRERCLFVSAGTVAPELAAQAERFAAAGGVLMNARISDGQLFDLYAVTDAVWCCYSPEYDQASGIFGRAVQFGKTAIVRRGSYVERFAEMIGHPAPAIGWHDDTDAAAVLLGLRRDTDGGEPGRRNAEMNRHNRELFRRYLG
jgi:hypothetical protein